MDEHKDWYVATPEGPSGPFSLGQLAEGLRTGAISKDAEVCPDGGSAWVPIHEVVRAGAAAATGPRLPPIPASSRVIQPVPSSGSLDAPAAVASRDWLADSSPSPEPHPSSPGFYSLLGIASCFVLAVIIVAVVMAEFSGSDERPHITPSPSGDSAEADEESLTVTQQQLSAFDEQLRTSAATQQANQVREQALASAQLRADQERKSLEKARAALELRLSVINDLNAIYNKRRAVPLTGPFPAELVLSLGDIEGRVEHDRTLYGSDSFARSIGAALKELAGAIDLAQRVRASGVGDSVRRAALSIALGGGGSEMSETDLILAAAESTNALADSQDMFVALLERSLAGLNEAVTEHNRLCRD